MRGSGFLRRWLQARGNRSLEAWPWGLRLLPRVLLSFCTALRSKCLFDLCLRACSPDAPGVSIAAHPPLLKHSPNNNPGLCPARTSKTTVSYLESSDSLLSPRALDSIKGVFPPFLTPRLLRSLGMELLSQTAATGRSAQSSLLTSLKA